MEKLINGVIVVVSYYLVTFGIPTLIIWGYVKYSSRKKNRGESGDK